MPDTRRKDLDKSLLHEFMWLNSNHRTGVCRYKQKDLCELFEMTKFQVSRLIGDMEDLGFVQRIGKGLAGTRIRVVDPEVLRWTVPAVPEVALA